MIIHAQKAKKAKKGDNSLICKGNILRVSRAKSPQEVYATQPCGPYCAVISRELRMKLVK